ncbi:MAG: cell division protein SepF [Methanobrevibacter sp.]|nr:cell division protein SepF [Candidatus Methanovirga meridionalis]
MGFIDQFKRSLGMEEEKRKPIKPFVEEILKSSSESISITPEQPFYEIILIKPKSEDDMDYVRDQIIEGNAVIVDVAYLEKEAFEMMGTKLNILRKEHKAEVILLGKVKNKHLILIGPDKIKIIKKG